MRRPGHPVRRPRVVMLLENNPYEVDVRVRSEAESLAAAGYDVTVLSPRGPESVAQTWVGAVRVERFRLPEASAGAASFLAEYVCAAVQLYARATWHLVRGADVVHIHNPPDCFFGVALLARALGRRAVFDHHDLTPEMVEAKLGSRAFRRLAEIFERASMRSSSVVLAANESHRELALTRGGVAPERVVVLRNGPPARVLDHHSPARDGRLADPVVVFVGEMADHDGVHELPDMLEALVHRHGLTGTGLVLAGRGPEREALEDAFRRLGLAGNVRFTGQIPHAQVFDLLAGADICVDPAPRTAYNDRCTIVKIAEYMAAGRPVVAHALTETRRTAEDAARYAGEAGPDLLADAIADLAGDPRARAAMGRRGRERAAGLTWSASEQVLLRVYAELLPAPASAAAPQAAVTAG